MEIKRVVRVYNGKKVKYVDKESKEEKEFDSFYYCLELTNGRRILIVPGSDQAKKDLNFIAEVEHK